MNTLFRQKQVEDALQLRFIEIIHTIRSMFQVCRYDPSPPQQLPIKPIEKAEKHCSLLFG